jgi:ankyrin repeat protein
MKTILPLAAILVTVARVAFAADPLSDTFQKGLIDEEANQDLDAAIQAYQLVIGQHDDQRPLVANALFRLGECYRKQGKTNEAIAQYQRVMRDFSDQANLVGPSGKILASLGRAGQPAGPAPAFAQTVTDPEQLKLLTEEIRLVEKEIAASEARFKAGKGESAEIAKAKKELLSLQRQLPDNASAAAQKNFVEQTILLVEGLLSEKKKQVEVGVAPPLDTVPFERELLGLKRELAAISKGPATVVAPGESASPGEAEELNEIQRLREVLRNSPDLINAKGPSDHRPIHTAVMKGQRAVVEFLLRNGADVGALTQGGENPLHLAVLAGHRAIAELLIENGSDVNGRNHLQATPLHIAASRGYKSIAELLLAKGADLNLTASRSGEIFGQTGADPSRSIRAQVTEGVPLCSAIMSSSGSVVDLLLAARPDVNRGDGQYMTPLHAAVIMGSTRVADRLLALGAKLEAIGPSGRTPLHLACVYGRVEMAEWLIGKGAAINPTDKNGSTPLHLAVNEETGKLAGLLLEKGADVNARDASNSTPLHYAVRSGRVEVVRRLLEAKPDLTIRDADAQTPLMRIHTSSATQDINRQMEKLLLNHGAQM